MQPHTSQLASKICTQASQLCIPAILSQAWNLRLGLNRYQVELKVDLDGASHQMGTRQFPPAALLSNSLSTLGVEVQLDRETLAHVNGLFCRGWRRYQNKAIVLVLSSLESRLLTEAESMVRGETWDEPGQTKPASTLL